LTNVLEFQTDEQTNRITQFQCGNPDEGAKCRCGRLRSASDVSETFHSVRNKICFFQSPSQSLQMTLMLAQFVVDSWYIRESLKNKCIQRVLQRIESTESGDIKTQDRIVEPPPIRPSTSSPGFSALGSQRPLAPPAKALSCSSAKSASDTSAGGLVGRATLNTPTTPPSAAAATAVQHAKNQEARRRAPVHSEPAGRPTRRASTTSSTTTSSSSHLAMHAPDPRRDVVIRFRFSPTLD